MQGSAEKIWVAAQEQLRSMLTADTFNLWFAPLRAQALEDGVLVDVSETAREAGFRFPVAGEGMPQAGRREAPGFPGRHRVWGGIIFILIYAPVATFRNVEGDNLAWLLEGGGIGPGGDRKFSRSRIIF